MKAISLSDLNSLTVNDYVARLDSLYEFSPWIVGQSAAHRPFVTLKSMQATMESIIYGADFRQKQELLQAHPDLAAKLDELSNLTEFSQAEQNRAGFGSLPAGEFEALRAELARYRDRFGHPFILCVSEHQASDTLPILRARIPSSPESELISCLAQVARIGWYRLQLLVSE